MRFSFFVLIVLYATSCVIDVEREHSNKPYKTIVLNTNEFIDIKGCIEKHSYPPHIPDNMHWTLPDTSNWGESAKQQLHFKYSFNEDESVQTFYYQGSLISAVFPLLYSFEYSPDNPNLVIQITDPFLKEKYLIDYYSDNSLETITKLDSTNGIIESLTVKKIKQ